MKNLLFVGLFVGILMYIGKYLVFKLLLYPTPKINKWIHKTPPALFALDLGFNAMATSMVQIAEGLTALIAAITFQFCSIGVIWLIIIQQKVIKGIRSFRPGRAI